MLSHHQPDLIVTDIMMPKMDGYELLSQVRENPAWVHIPVIFLTARGERRDVIRGRSSGAEEYIIKPYDSDELLELVVKQLDRYFQMQGAIRQDFDQLKRGILDLLQPDFRLPLTSVSDHSQKLAISLEEIETDEDLKESLRGIQFASRRITQLVEDFIFLAESRTGEVISSFNLLARPTNASMILLEASDLCRAEANRQGIVLEYELDMNLPPALIDYEKFRTAVQRLIETLIEFCAARQLDKIMAISSFQGQSVHLSLNITGSSFSTQTVEQINRLFEQEDVNRLEFPEYDPNLVVTRTIVDLHNGRIRLLNEPGRSSTFVISLPIYQPDFEIDQE
jgi:CheY-like chemotaxis protein